MFLGCDNNSPEAHAAVLMKILDGHQRNGSIRDLQICEIDFEGRMRVVIKFSRTLQPPEAVPIVDLPAGACLSDHGPATAKPCGLILSNLVPHLLR